MQQDDDNAQRKALLFLAEKLFTPLGKLFLRHGVTVPTLERVLRRCSIHVAANDPEFAVEREDDKYRQTYSHAAVVTGLNRSQVSRALQATEIVTSNSSRKAIDRLDRILKGWRSDPGYQDNEGRPCDLPLRGPRPSLHQLCQKYGGDTPTRPVADILIKNGNAKWIGDIGDMARGKMLRYLHSVVTAPAGSMEDTMILAQIASDFINTIDQSFNPDVQPTPRLRETFFDDIDTDRLDEALEFANAELQAFITHCGKELQKFRAESGKSGIRVGIGAYTFRNAPNLLGSEATDPDFIKYTSYTTHNTADKEKR